MGRGTKGAKRGKSLVVGGEKVILLLGLVK